MQDPSIQNPRIHAETTVNDVDFRNVASCIFHAGPALAFGYYSIRFDITERLADLRRRHVVESRTSYFHFLESRRQIGLSRHRALARATEQDANAIAAWAPSNGALITDQSNKISVNYHPLPGGRFALSRTCEGPLEFSGRGGRQLYTHVLLLDADALRSVASGPIAIYRDALALGRFVFRPIRRPCLNRSHSDRLTSSANRNTGSTAHEHWLCRRSNQSLIVCAGTNRSGSPMPAIGLSWPNAFWARFPSMFVSPSVSPPV